MGPTKTNSCHAKNLEGEYEVLLVIIYTTELISTIWAPKINVVANYIFYLWREDDLS